LGAVRDRPEDRPGNDADAKTKTEWATKLDRAYAIMHLSLEPSALAFVSECKTAHGIWAELRRQFDKPSWTRRLALRREFHQLYMLEATSARDHIVRLKGIVSELASIGDKIPEELVVIQLLNSLPPSYNTLLTASENIQAPQGVNATAPTANPTPWWKTLMRHVPPKPSLFGLPYVTATLIQEEERGAATERMGSTPSSPRERSRAKGQKRNGCCRSAPSPLVKVNAAQERHETFVWAHLAARLSRLGFYLAACSRVV